MFEHICITMYKSLSLKKVLRVFWINFIDWVTWTLITRSELMRKAYELLSFSFHPFTPPPHPPSGAWNRSALLLSYTSSPFWFLYTFFFSLSYAGSTWTYNSPALASQEAEITGMCHKLASHFTLYECATDIFLFSMQPINYFPCDIVIFTDLLGFKKNKSHPP